MKLAVNTLIFSVAALLALGTVMLYSSSMTQAGADYLVKQLIWCGFGLAGGIVLAAFDYRLFKKYALPLLAFAILILLAVRLFGRNINGAHRWFTFGGFSFQPSELAKLITLVVVAWYGEHFQRQMRSVKYGVLLPAAIIGPVLALILCEPDVGSTLLLAAACTVVLLLAGIRLRYVMPPVLIGLLAVGTFVYFNQNRSERIYSWLHVEETRREKGLQAWESMVALGSGGVSGKGLGNGMQKRGFVPEHHTDFIFCIIGEELGIFGTCGILLAFLVLLGSALYISSHASDHFGFLLGCGITFLIGMQAVINIGVVTSAFPNKGLPLPFISYGGSSLLVMLANVGVLLSIARHARVKSTSRNADADDVHSFAPAR